MTTAQTIALAALAILTIAICAPRADCDNLTAQECERQQQLIDGVID